MQFQVFLARLFFLLIGIFQLFFSPLFPYSYRHKQIQIDRNRYRLLETDSFRSSSLSQFFYKTGLELGFKTFSLNKSFCQLLRGCYKGHYTKETLFQKPFFHGRTVKSTLLFFYKNNFIRTSSLRFWWNLKNIQMLNYPILGICF